MYVVLFVKGWILDVLLFVWSKNRRWKCKLLLQLLRQKHMQIQWRRFQWIMAWIRRFYKNAKQLYVSKNRYRYIFVFAALSIISIAMLTVLISDMFVYVQTANNMLKITNTPTALIEQAFMDIWCALALIIVSSIVLFISVCFCAQCFVSNDIKNKCAFNYKKITMIYLFNINLNK